MSRWLQFGVIVSAVLLIILATAVVSVFSFNCFQRELKPAEHQKAIIVSQLLANLVSEMNAYGVPLDRFRGMEEIFTRVQRSHPNIIYLSVESGDRLLYERAVRPKMGDSFYSVAEPSSLPTGFNNIDIEQFVSEVANSKEATIVRLGIDKHYFLEKQKENYLDIATVLVVSMLMAIELLVFLFVFTIQAPMQRLKQAMQAVANKNFTVVYEFDTADEVGRCGRLLNQLIVKINQHFYSAATPAAVSNQETHQATHQETLHLQQIKVGPKGKIRYLFDQALVYMRPPLFLVIFAESMSLSFFPSYVDQLYSTMAPLPISKDLVLGIPISIFMLVWAISLPFAGQWSDRIGRRKAFWAGAMVTAVGLILTSLSGDIYQLIFWRSLTAVGYGVVFITAQSYVTDLTTPENRTKGMALFLSGFFSGSLCGAATGGILADRIGFEATFILSAVLAIAAAFFASRFFVDHSQDQPSAKPAALSWTDIKCLFSNRAFIVITFLAAIPGKAALTGFVYYVGPIYLSVLGASKSMSGRVLMAYGLAIVVFSPLTAWLIDKYKQQKTFILFGGFLSALALLVVGLTGNIEGLGLGVFLLGFAHACSVSPQSSLISAKVVNCSGVAVGKTIGIFRLTERIGNISGPILAGVLIGFWGYEKAFILFAGFLAVSSVLLFCFIGSNKETPKGITEKLSSRP